MQTPSELRTEIAPDSNDPARNFKARLLVNLYKPVDISFLVAFRILFGSVLLWEIYRYFSRGWISRYFIEPAINFTFFGFSWVKPWPGQGMYVHFGVLAVAAFCVIIGFGYRLAAPVFCLGFTYVFFLDETRYLNHFYLVCLLSFLMCFLPAERAFSVDSWLRLKIRTDEVPAWTLWLLRIQVGIPYFYGGIAKLNSDWIHGGEPMRTWLSPLAGMPAVGHLLTSEFVVYMFVYNGLLLDLFVVPLLLWRRTRPFAFAAAVMFNLINSIIFQIGIFPWLMLGALLIYFPPDLMRRIVRGIFSSGDENDSQPALKANLGNSWNPGRQKLIVGILATHLGIQLLLPFRHFLYPGNVSWNEEGHNFAWHMKLRTKTGEAVFTVTHPQSGKIWTIKPEDHLRPHQSTKMIVKPDLILQFSHYLAELKRREGYENVEVRARVLISLNGRERQLMIDPNVDLTKAQASLFPASWIAPLSTSLESRATSGAKTPDSPIE